jgi:2-oxoisovalerate dehydrogenase E1 component
MTLIPPRIENGRAVIPADPLHIFAYASFIRFAEEEALRLYHEGHVAGTIHTCLGQELCQMAVVRALLPQDHVLSNHRNHGHLLSFCGDSAGFFAELTGRQGALCGGRGGSQHMAAGKFHSNGVQGGMTAIAAGLALAERFSGGDGIVAAMIGDGTLGEGLLYEAMNLAALWSLPVLFVVENNGIAQTTPTDRGVAGDMLARGQAFGLASRRLSDTDPELMEKAAAVVTEVRDTRRPAYLVIETARLGPHSKGDDLRPKAEIARIEARDPLMALNLTESQSRIL